MTGPNVAVGTDFISANFECRFRKGDAAQPCVRKAICFWIVRENDQIEIGIRVGIAPRPRPDQRKSAQVAPFLDPESDDIDKYFRLCWRHGRMVVRAISAVIPDGLAAGPIRS